MSSSNIYIDTIKQLSVQGKYTNWYCSIILNAKQRQENNEYKENHHILPKCLCETPQQQSDNLNIVSLTAREHFIVHYLLTKMIKHHKISYALIAFQQNKTKRKLTSRQYDVIRKTLSTTLCGKKLSDEHKKKISESSKGIPKPAGFAEKRSLYNKTHNIKPPSQKGICKTKEHREKMSLCKKGIPNLKLKGLVKSEGCRKKLSLTNILKTKDKIEINFGSVSLLLEFIQNNKELSMCKLSKLTNISEHIIEKLITNNHYQNTLLSI